MYGTSYHAHPSARKNSGSRTKYSSPTLNKFNLLGTLATRELINILGICGRISRPSTGLEKSWSGGGSPSEHQRYWGLPWESYYNNHWLPRIKFRTVFSRWRMVLKVHGHVIQNRNLPDSHAGKTRKNCRHFQVWAENRLGSIIFTSRKELANELNREMWRCAGETRISWSSLQS